MDVLMVDDHVMFLQGLKNLLSVMAADLRVHTADTLSMATELAQITAYDLVLLDWHLAECDGAESIRRLRDAGCSARIVVLSGETSADIVRGCVDVGAAGFIPKKYSSEMMVSALNNVLSGRLFLPPEVLRSSGGHAARADAGAAETDSRLAVLTPRQIDAYRAAARGLPNKLIARELGVAESTVKSHLSAVYQALGVHNRTEAAYQASRDGVRIV